MPDFRGYGQDREVFEKIALVCFQSVLPRKVWLSNFDKKVLSSYMTVADEALAYLILENNFVDWLKIAKKEVEDVKKEESRQSIPWWQLPVDQEEQVHSERVGVMRERSGTMSIMTSLRREEKL